MNIGKLDRRLTIQAATETRDSFGGVTVTWADVATVAAERKPVSGSEPYDAAGKVGQSVTEFVIRYRPDVNQQTRAVCEGTTYDVVEVLEMSRRVGLKLKCVVRRAETEA